MPKTQEAPTERVGDDGQTPEFTVARLIRDARMLGYSRHVVAGALSNLNPNTYLTVEDGKKAVKDFLGTEV
jgi:hypothetical protein